MLNIILICLVIIAKIIVVVLGFLTLFYTDNSKKNWLLLTLCANFIFLLGHLLELMSTDTSAAFTAVKILYVGLVFMCPFMFFMIADYCDVKVSLIWVRIPLMIFSLAVVVLLWTTDKTHLLYREFWLDAQYAHSLEYNPGILFLILHIYPAIMMLASIIPLINCFIKRERRYRKGFLLLIITVLIPFFAEYIHFFLVVSNIDTYNVYLTPYSFLITVILFYIITIKWDVFGIASVPNERTIEYISEPCILIDEQHNYLMSNSAAKVFLPELEEIKHGAAISNIDNWPEKLKKINIGNNKYKIDFSMESRIEPGTKNYYVADVSRSQTLLGKKNTMAIIIRDMTSLHSEMKELEGYAYRDSLTGLNNRRHFFELVGNVVSRADRTGIPYYIIMLDLDYFKKINDNYGHLAGDEVLKEIAYTINEAVRDYDIVARYGGEEFIILVSDLSREELIIIAERIRTSVKKRIIRYGEVNISITISIGIAGSKQGKSIMDLIADADKALYTAKEKRDMVVLMLDDKIYKTDRRHE